MSQEKNKKIKLEKGETYFNAAARIGDDLYYSAKNTNGLFRADLKTGKSEFITVFDTDREMDIHRFAFSVKNEVWFIPNCLPDRIAILNIDSFELEYMDIPEPKKARDGFLFMMNPIIKGELVWLVPGVYDAFLCLDTRNRTTKKIDLPVDDFEDYIAMQGCEYDEKIYLCPWGCSKILYLDMASEEIQALDVVIEKNMYSGFFIIDNCIYLFPRKSPNDILEIDLSEHVCCYRSLGVGDTETDIVAAYYDSDRKQITIFPSVKENCIYIYHMDNCGIELVELEYNADHAFYGGAFWGDFVKISEDTYLAISTDRTAPILECHDQDFKTFLLDEPEDLVAGKLLSMIETKEQKKERMKEQGKIGEKIYQVITSDAP